MLKWWQKGIVYQIYPKSFQSSTGSGTGDIQGIISRLDYIQKLGANAVWITPIYPSPMVDNGYDISDYTAIAPEFGTMADFEELVSEAGKRGIKIVMDLVFNHTSNQHNWFKQSSSSLNNPKADWYIWADPKPDGSPPTNWRSIFGGSAWTFSPARGQYYLHTFAPEQPDLNWENPSVRKALYDAAKFWLNKGAGGFRIDAIVYIKKPAEFLDGPADCAEGTVNIHTMTANQAGILEFLREFRREVVGDRDIFTVGEANGVTPEELPDWVGSNGVFDMVFEFSHQTLEFGASEIWCKPKRWTVHDLTKALTDSQNAVAQNGWYPIYFENHDQPRSVNHFFPAGTDTKKAAKLLGAVLLTLRGTPFIYQGEELGMSNREWRSIDQIADIQAKGQYDLAVKEGYSPEEAMEFIGRYTRDNARIPVEWGAVDLGAGTGAEVLKWYSELSAFRRKSSILLEGTYRELMSGSGFVYAYVREHEGRRIVTAVNFSEESVIRINTEEFLSMLCRMRVRFSSENSDTNELPFLWLAPLEARIYVDD